MINLVAYERYEEVFSITYFSLPMDLHSAHLVVQSKFSEHDPDARLALSNAYNILVHENPPEKAQEFTGHAEPKKQSNT